MENYTNLASDELLRLAVESGEGKLTKHQALVVLTGKYTGRAAKNKFITRHATSENTIWWENNNSIDENVFNKLLDEFQSIAKTKKMHVQDLIAGADESFAMPVRVYTQLAWHALFIRHLLRVPNENVLQNFTPELTIINLPQITHNGEAIIAINLEKKIVLIGGTQYSGEIKKSVFTVLNYFLPQKNILPMHCSANENMKTSETALFFGLSGTGKTTLSADGARRLIGDDEHGWSQNGIFNFEGGCYAKTLNLTQQSEPEIFAASQQRATILENVKFENGEINFADDSITQNGRLAYPLEAIANASPTGMGAHPNHIFMLTADACGILPPIALLSPEQAVYHFLSGYTAKVAGTESGVEGVQATFSTCFGAPFMPRHPHIYGELLQQKIKQHKTKCWLLNTGWTHGAYGEGYRIPLAKTRAMLKLALDGELEKVATEADKIFCLAVPKQIAGIEATMLRPRDGWQDKDKYDEKANELAKKFANNFRQFENQVSAEIIKAGPKID